MQSLPHARFIDILNILVNKGTTFCLTLSIFTLISSKLTVERFAEFGYWWSMAIMLGGVTLGGLSSALIREVAILKSLQHLSNTLRVFSVTLIITTLILIIFTIATPQGDAASSLFLVASLFGIAIQLQTAVFSLLRASDATVTNAIASLAVLVLVPVIMVLWIDAESGTVHTLTGATIAFAISSVISIAIGHRVMRPLWASTVTPTEGNSEFLRNVIAFTVVNFFSYIALNIDFIIFKTIGDPIDFITIATSKIYFERFLLPVLLVFSSAVSLGILRKSNQLNAIAGKAEVTIDLKFIVIVLGAATLLSVSYYLLSSVFYKKTSTLEISWLVALSLGYIFYTANGILFDLLVLRRSLAHVAKYIFYMLVFASLIQSVAISFYGVRGWAYCWLSFNAGVMSFLSWKLLNIRWKIFSNSNNLDDSIK